MSKPFEVMLRNVQYGSDDHEAIKQYLLDSAWHEKHDVGDPDYADSLCSGYQGPGNGYAYFKTGFDDQAEAMLFKLTFSQYL